MRPSAVGFCSVSLLSLIVLILFIHQYTVITWSNVIFTILKPKKMLILDWTGFFGKPLTDKWNASLSFCNTTQFQFTSDRSLLDSADAVIFHHRDINTAELPDRRKPWQLFVWFNMESPVNTGRISLRVPPSYFNLTMTYRRDSDVWYPYGSFQKSLKKVRVKNDAQLLEIARNKTNLMAWFVSHCHTTSRREVFVDQLSAHLPNNSIDVFGSCGNYSCPRGENENVCDDMLTSDYKFYLSLENSVCDDYVTEKFWKRANRYIVPIVLRAKDYRNLGVPDEMYIAADSFKSVKDLADRILYLDEHSEQYIKHLHWQDYGRIEYDGRDQRLCALCKYLHEYGHVHKIIADLDSWWNPEGICVGSFALKLLS